MQKEPEGLYRSIRLLHQEQKGSCMGSRLCTQITTNLESVSFDSYHEAKAQTDNRERQTFVSKKVDQTVPIVQTELFEQSSFESLFQTRFQELEQRTSRVINLLPQFQSRARNGGMLPLQAFQSHILQEDKQISNKFRIIKDLQFKIMQLESNISNPNACKEDVLTIQKEINLNFQNYYAQSKENRSQSQSTPINTQSTPEKQQKQNQPECPQEDIDKINLNRFYNSYKQYDICLLIPKIIEIEVPIPTLKIVAPTNNGQIRSDLQTKLLRRSKSYSQKSNSQGSGSSISQIIREFNKNLREQGLVKKVYTYQQDQPEIYIRTQETINEESSGFHLPLDSFEKIANNDVDDYERTCKLKPTDRSNISSTSELDKIREEIWNKECIEFNQQHLSQVKQNEQKSESNEDHCLQRQREFKEESYDRLTSEEIIQLSKQIVRLEEQLQLKQNQLAEALEKSRQLEAKSVQKQIQMLQLLEKHESLGLAHHDQLLLVQHLKKQAEEHELVEQELKNRVFALQKELIRVTQDKDTESQQLLRILHQKNEQMSEMIKLNQYLKAVILKKQQAFEAQSQQLEGCLLRHKEEVNYYKSKLEEEEGFKINLEEASIIRDLIQHQEHTHKHQPQLMYQTTINSFKSQQENYEKIIEQLQRENRKLSQRYNILGSQYELFEQKFVSLMKDYHNQQLEQPTYLSRKAVVQLSEINEICDEDIRVLDSIVTNLINQPKTVDQSSLNFICAVSRIIRRLKFCESNWAKERKERQSLTGKLKRLNLSINREIEKAEERADRFHKENARYKQQNQQLTNQLRKSQAKLKLIKSQLDEGSKLVNCANDRLRNDDQQMTKQLKKSTVYEDSQYKDNQNQAYLEQTMRIQQSHISHQQSQLSRVRYFQLASSVVSISSIPLKMMLPKKITAPLPPIPIPTALPASLTLDKLLLRRSWWRPETKTRFLLKLLDLCSELVRVSRKLFSLKPCQMMVSGLQGDIEIVVRRQFGNTSEQDENSLLYRAPEVLLGFSETEASYVWSMGVIMDQVWHEKPFYKKISEVLSRKENYEVRDSSLPAKDLLIRILRKNQKERPSLKEVKEQLLFFK